MDAIAVTHPATSAMRLLMGRVRDLMAARHAHPAHTVVLMPYVHVLSHARTAWAQEAGDGFAPRFETTRSWCGAMSFEPHADSIAMDMGRDLLTARAWIERAGLRQHADLLAGRLVEAAWQISPAAAAVPPSQRDAWAVSARAALATSLDSPVLAFESAVARIAVEWAAASRYAADTLFAPGALDDLELLVVIEGLQHDALAQSLAAQLPDRSHLMPLSVESPMGAIRLYEAPDPASEAEQAAACVIAHVNADRVPVALGAMDRVLTRRVHAMLAARGVAVRDETGWKLSTTRRAADVMLALRACAWNAGTDAVIDWLKNAPSLSSRAVLGLERRIRRAGFVREWRALRSTDVGDDNGEGVLAALVEQVQAWRETMQGQKTVAEWMAALRELLRTSGQWTPLVRDAAGAGVVGALRLAQGDEDELLELPQAGRRWSLDDFMAWVNDVLEAESFKPEQAAREQVVILPVSQMLGRPFGALVVPGCDEKRLTPSPEPAGIWTPDQRAVLGLPLRESVEAEIRAAWRHAMQTPHCDVLWRRSDESGEPLLPSPLVQVLQLELGLKLQPDPRDALAALAQPTPRPMPSGALLPVTQLSASGYSDLRSCPYRFFAMRQLGLQEADEIDTEVGKRDFGSWLHKVLGAFHETLAQNWEPAGAQRARLLDSAADAVTREMRFDESEFLPFAAAWPGVRDGYLDWLGRHEADEGATFVEAEGQHELELGAVKLVGRIDRIDSLRDGSRMVMDYKTEAAAASSKRVSKPGEDTQLAFYAALLPDDTLRAAYVNVGERGETRKVEQERIVEERDMLVEGILHDVARIAAGEKLPALGEAKACDYCGARGLCRKDSWT
ncbi:MAG: PD-(D/E)XK nuclease family protein [Pseudomonadota bacterium]